MNLSIRTRLVAGFSVIVALICAYNVYDTVHTEQTMETLGRQHGKAAYLARAQNAMWELRYGPPQYLAVPGPQDRRRIVGAEPGLYATFEHGLQDFAASGDLSPPERDGARAVQLAFERYRRARPHWFELVDAGQLEEAATWRAATTLPYGAAAIKALAELIDTSEREDRKRLMVLLAEERRRDEVAGGVLLLCALLIAWWVYRGLARPLDRLQATIERVAAGDLKARSGMAGTDELASLGTSFDRLLDAHLLALDRVQSENDELSRSMQALMEAEQRVAEGEHLMRVMADHMPVRLAYWDADRRCRFVNRKYCELLGVERDQVLGARRDTRVFEREGTLQLDDEHMAAALKGSARRMEQEATDADGHATSWIVHYLPHFAEGEVAGVFTVAQDVTELRRARDAAVAASQAKSRFLSSMSHEIRTPMNAVVGMLALLQATGLDSRQKDYTDKAEGAARSLLSLLNDILDFSKIEAGRMQLEPRAFSLDALLADLSTILAGAVGRKPVEVLYDIDSRIPDRLVADDMRLRQILINLGGNAVKFTQSGEVVVQLRLLSASANAVRVEFAVRDTGIGITPEQCTRLFDDYAQASGEIARAFGGTGLGLSICRRLAAMMGSDLHVQSTAGAGSRFWFEVELPLAAAVAAPAADALPIERVLIVDDNVVARESLAGIAASQGWRADVASSGREALERLGSPGTRYDAIFIDWNMPGLDGWETSLRIREMQAGKEPQLLLMLTAYGREMLGRRPAAEQALIDGYLVKPVTGSMIEAALRDALGGPAAARRPGPVACAPLAGLKLLLVEDNVVNQQIAYELLTREGAEIDVAADGRQAVDRLALGHRYDLVLMDVLMPVMGGLEATRHIRQQLGLRELPILAMTANAMDNDREECMAAGMDGHIGKPFVLEDLVRTIQSHAHGRPCTAPPAPQAAAAGHAELPLWDREKALSVLGGQPDLLERIVRIFGDDLRSTIAALRQALPAQDLLRHFHTLKAAAAGVGASRLASVAAAAEKAARHAPEEAGRQVGALLAVAEQTLLELA
ncbi:hybrid sensor histidine kinase/response regulator [Ramlibacter humi]|uniref:Sensory/regulatory protein RpfC n=1 Tax=Ramlibacter humi TaxID=2530451 RepID=A0A4Z0CBI9_9BURK|nr:response regulator [Ramlibacter humi]TFZ07788.1 response regulator [Ramlibacter humi]